MPLPPNVELRLRCLYDESLLNWHQSRLREIIRHKGSIVRDLKQKATRNLIREHPFMPLEQLKFISDDSIFSNRQFDVLGTCGESLHFLASTYLTFQDGNPVCRFELLPDFTDIRLQVFTDQIACWSVAHRLYSDRSFFDPSFRCNWPIGLKYDRSHLSEELKEGLVDGHVHLGGVPTTIDLLYELTNPKSHLLNLDALRKWKTDLNDRPFSDLIILRLRQACMIRDVLKVMLNARMPIPRRDILSFTDNSDSKIKGTVQTLSIIEQIFQYYEFELQANRYQSSNRFTAYLKFISSGTILPRRLPQGLVFSFGRNGFFNSIDEERRLLVMAFCAVFGMFGSMSPWFTDLLVMYLTLQNVFHRVVTQAMRRPGFSNFVDWYDSKARKLFASSDERRQGLILSRVTDNWTTRVEGRITPERDTVASWLNALRIHNPSQDYKLGRDFGFIVHFIKDEYHPSRNKPATSFRYHQKSLWRRQLRRKLRHQAFELEDQRAQNQEIAHAILAIDAARHEKDASPELFAPAFRYLRRPFTGTGHSKQSLFVSPLPVPPLKATFHVGEFFNHPISGLRAVDEAIRFLHLNSGDRIGHGTVMGIDYSSWIRNTGTNPYLSREELFDNLVWMADRLQGRGEYRELITPLLPSISREFETLYRCESVPNPRTLTDLLAAAWKLRWMDPEPLFSVLKAFGFFQGVFLKDKKHRNDPSDTCLEGVFLPCHVYHNCAIDRTMYQCDLSDSRNWKRCFAVRSVDATSRDLDWRTATIGLDEIFSGDIPKASLRYLWIYHHDKQYKERAQRPVICKDDLTNWPVLFDVLRDIVLSEIEKRDITIEVCPTSNYMIGGFGEFSSHPIFKFDTTGLKAQVKRRVRVMVNTDNPGIFSTNLENEYALLASAAESRGENPSDVLAWIRHLKQQSKASSFLRREGFDHPDLIAAMVPVLTTIPAMNHKDAWYKFLKMKASHEKCRTRQRIYDSFGFTKSG